MAPKTKEKPKPSPSPSPAIPIEDLFANLNRHIQRSEYEEATKVADQVLAVAPGDEDALRCKIVALIKADDIDRALSAIQAAEKRPFDFSFFKPRENIFCLAIRGSDSLSFRRMDACVNVYEKLQRSKIESLEINVAASLISSGRASEVQKMLDLLKIKATSSFELAYNVAYSLIEEKRYNDAEQLLLSARRIGQETLMEDNWADDEIEIELAPIAVQLAYVQQLLGQSLEAMDGYKDIIKKNLADDSSLAVAINNLISLRGPKDVSDSLRKLDGLIEKDNGPKNFQLARGLDLKLSSKQKEAIYSNQVLLLLFANKIAQARELVAVLPGMFPGCVMPVLLESAVLVKENKAGKAEEILLQFANRFPEASKVVFLARAQVAAAAGHLQVAADSLARVPDIQHMPATVATLVSLKERAGDIDGATAVLNDAIKWWSNSMTENNSLSLIMQEAASFMLRHGREEAAANLYENLVKSHGSAEALAGLVSTAAHVNIDKAETYEKNLKPLSGLKGVDIDSLEKTSGAHVESGGNLQNIRTYVEGKGKAKSKKKRKRKPKYPKGFDPANPGPPPDPERWLPKRERSSYRPKRKDKRAAQVRGSQGAIGRERHENNGASSATTSKLQQASASAKAEQPSKASTSKPSKKKSRK
ncbi:hypothetical protein Scep_018069 [Stephania cephalantha]|uniref:Signal recognition particle subunit SRP72 n=2 Tax=Stephania cephalantha TaxID=152367 RepID=A0AAP0IQR7_9MAGN